MNNLLKSLGYSGPTNATVPFVPPHGIPYMGIKTPVVGVTEWDYESYFKDQVKIQHPEDERYAGDRRGIHALSTFNYLFGIPRIGFDIPACNVAKTNPFFILNESIVCDYLRQQSFDVVDKDGNRKDKLYEWFKNPNPQQTFWDVWLPAVRDMFAYDAGVVVVTYSEGGWARELHAYRGTEFWAELDKMIFSGEGLNVNYSQTTYISHGYISRWWQHAANGLFIPYRPEEVLYMMRYPQSGTVYGTDIMKYFRFHYRGLMSATVAYGKIMDNGLNAGVVFRHPDIGSIDTLQERLEGLKKVNQGPTNYGKPLHLIGNEEVSTISANNLAGQQFIEGIRFNSYLISNLFGLPSSEFSLETSGANRMSSYNSKDIRKSRGIGTVLSIISNLCNRVLKRLKGYTPGDQFIFDDKMDIDDQLKAAYVVSQNMTSFKMACPTAQFPPDIALKLVSFGKNLTSEEKDRIYDMVQGTEYGDDTATPRTGRYDGDDYEETFMGYKDINVNFNEMRSLKHPESRGA